MALSRALAGEAGNSEGMLKYMSHDDVRGALDANELSPRFDETEAEEE